MKREQLMEAIEPYIDSLLKLEQEDGFYDFEKKFGEIWQLVGRSAMQKIIGDKGRDHRTKKNPDPLR
jgi:hypothetical protein